MDTSPTQTKSNWFTYANCRGYDPDIFYADLETKQFPEGGALAKSICADCPVKTECVDYAMSISESHGIWGGMNFAQRTRLRRKRVKTFDQFEADVVPDIYAVADVIEVSDSPKVDGTGVVMRETQDWLDEMLGEDESFAEDPLQFL